MVWGPIPWQHSWQVVWVKKDSKSTSSCCSFVIQTSAIGWRIYLNLIRISMSYFKNFLTIICPDFTKASDNANQFIRIKLNIELQTSMMTIEIPKKGVVLGLWNILKDDHWCSSIIYYTLIIWQIKSNSLRTLHILMQNLISSTLFFTQIIICSYQNKRSYDKKITTKKTIFGK